LTEIEELSQSYLRERSEVILKWFDPSLALEHALSPRVRVNRQGFSLYVIFR